MKSALVIHPRFTLYGGGELLCLHVIRALQERGRDVILATDRMDIGRNRKIYGPIADCLLDVKHLSLPAFKPVIPRFLAYQRVMYAVDLQSFFERIGIDVVFSTQSSLYHVRGKETYHFIYDVVDLSVLHLRDPGLSIAKLPYYTLLRRYRGLLDKPEPNRHFIALGKKISADLDGLGYANEIVMPPCPLDFDPLPKKSQVVQATRVVPQKRLEEFLKIARLLPQFDFHILGLINKPFSSYKEHLFKNAPLNVIYHESPLRDSSTILRESKIYLYTSREPGLPIAFIQGIGAGCFPLAPDSGGGREAIEISRVGLCYRSIEDAVGKIGNIMSLPNDPIRISKMASAFSPEAFREKVGGLLG